MDLRKVVGATDGKCVLIAGLDKRHFVSRAQNPFVAGTETTTDFELQLRAKSCVVLEIPFQFAFHIAVKMGREFDADRRFYFEILLCGNTSFARQRLIELNRGLELAYVTRLHCEYENGREPKDAVAQLRLCGCVDLSFDTKSPAELASGIDYMRHTHLDISQPGGIRQGRSFPGAKGDNGEIYLNCPIAMGRIAESVRKVQLRRIL